LNDGMMNTYGASYSGTSQEYDDGYNAGYNDGSMGGGAGDTYDDGYNDGYNDGMMNTYGESYNGTSPEYDDGYNAGYNEGSGQASLPHRRSSLHSQLATLNRQPSALRSSLSTLRDYLPSFGSVAYAADPPPPPPGDTQTAEYAVYQYEYYPEGHQNQFLKSAEIDPNGNRTDYEYNANNLLVKIIQPADEAGGPRAETTFTYDAAGRLKTTTDPMGRTTERFYDERGRVVKILYADGSTERVFFGTGAEANLVVKKKDRSGVVTNYEYDSAGRRTRTVHAAATMDQNDNETPITDPSVTVEEAVTYVDGTDRVASRTRAGETTTMEYDYRHRVSSTTIQPRVGKTLTSTTHYLNNQLFCREDPYGRKTYHAYRVSDGALIRQAQAAIPNPTSEPTDFAGVLTLTRGADPDPNAQWIITDYILDDGGNTIEKIDGRGIRHTTSHDSRGQLVERVDAFGTSLAAKTELDYDANGNVTEIRAPRYFDSNDTNGYQNCRTTMTYTGRDLLASRTDAPGTPEAATESYSYTLDGRRDTHTDARGNDWRSIYHACCARQQASIDPLGHGMITNTDYSGNVTHSAVVADIVTHSDPHDPVDSKTLKEVTTRHDKRGRPVARTTWLVPLGNVDPNNVPIAGLDGTPSSDGLTDRLFYDDNLTDGQGLDGGVTVAKIDGSGNFVLDISQLINELSLDGTDFGIDSDGSAVVALDGEDRIGVELRDGMNREVAGGFVKQDGTPLSWWTKHHDIMVTVAGFGDVLELSEADALDHTTRFRSDGAGRTIEVVDAENNVTRIEYDGLGNQISFEDPNGNGKDTVYDALNRITSYMDGEGGTMQFAYDLAGNQVSVTDAKGAVANLRYDARDRHLETTDRGGSVRSIAYDATDNVISRSDGDGNTTNMTYDARGLRLSVAHAGHVPSSVIGDADYDQRLYTYDAAKRPATSTDQLGDTCTFLHDMAGRLIQKDYRTAANSPSGVISDSDVFSYDMTKELASATSGRYGNAVAFSHDETGNKTESLTVGGFTYSVTKDYDAAGRLVSLTYPDGTVVTQAYTDRDQLSGIDYEGVSVASFTYDAGMGESSRTFGNGLVATRTYRADDLVSSIDVSGKPGLSFAYTYDANKNVTSETLGGVMAPYAADANGYDERDRLTSYHRQNGDSQTWALGAEGDWDSTTVNGVPENRTHNVMHEVTSIDGVSLSYDAKGNIDQDHSGRLYQWDFENRLASTSSGGSSATYTYDALQRRVTKTADGETTVFVSIQQPEGGQTLAEYALGADPGTTAPLRKYVFGEYIDEPLMKIEDGGGGEQKLYYHRNRIHSVVGLTDTNGEVVERYLYSAYGDPTILEPADGSLDPDQASDFNNDLLFAGYRFDPESGLYYCRLRMYHPELGRFMQRDPLGFIDGLSLYEYADSNPLVYTDPTGGCSKPPPRLDGPNAGSSRSTLVMSKFVVSMVLPRIG